MVAATCRRICWRSTGSSVDDLRDCTAERRVNVLNLLRRQTLAHLDSAWEYVLALKPYKLRYACALPVLIGLETLGLHCANVAAGDQLSG